MAVLHGNRILEKGLFSCPGCLQREWPQTGSKYHQTVYTVYTVVIGTIYHVGKCIFIASTLVYCTAGVFKLCAEPFVHCVAIDKFSLERVVYDSELQCLHR